MPTSQTLENLSKIRRKIAELENEIVEIENDLEIDRYRAKRCGRWEPINDHSTHYQEIMDMIGDGEFALILCKRKRKALLALEQVWIR